MSDRSFERLKAPRICILIVRKDLKKPKKEMNSKEIQAITRINAKLWSLVYAL